LPFAGTAQGRCRCLFRDGAQWDRQAVALLGQGAPTPSLSRRKNKRKGIAMGRGILLWLIGVPIPIIILLAIFFHH
jgi:hypothetical protein